MKVKQNRAVLFIFIGLAIIYSLVGLLTPPDARSLNRYGLNSGSARAINLSVIVPYIAIWFTAFYGYTKLKLYSEGIKKTTDGKAMSKIADGLLVLALSMPLGAVTSSIGTNLRRNNPDLLPATVIINNYTNLLAILIAFYLIYSGAKKLSGLLKTKDAKTKSSTVITTVLVVFSISYAYLALSDPARQYPTETSTRASYYLPDWLLLFTIVIPYIIVWYLGFRSVMYITNYLVNVPGKLYRNSLQYLAFGIFFAVLSIIALRFLSSMTAWFDGQQLKIILIILYLLLILIATGYVLIAKGAKKLHQIEEV